MKITGVVINARREGYGLDQIDRTMTVGELIAALSEFDEDTPVFVGNDPQSYGWYTYGGIRESDVCEYEDNEDEEEDYDGI